MCLPSETMRKCNVIIIPTLVMSWVKQENFLLFFLNTSPSPSLNYHRSIIYKLIFRYLVSSHVMTSVGITITLHLLIEDPVRPRPRHVTLDPTLLSGLRPKPPILSLSLYLLAPQSYITNVSEQLESNF